MLRIIDRWELDTPTTKLPTTVEGFIVVGDHLDKPVALVRTEKFKGQDIVDSIKQGDTIESIEILDSTDALFESEKKLIAAWNKAIEENQ